MKLTMKLGYQIFFVILIGLMLHPSFKEKIIHLVSFSPSVIKEENREVLKDYNWELKGLNVASLNAEALKGKVIFLNFWATWCPPCRAELPSIQKLYNDYKNKISYIFITNEKQDVVENFYKKNDYDLPTYTFESDIPEIFKTTSIPQTFVIDAKGEVVISKNGAADWNSKKIREVLNKLIQNK